MARHKVEICGVDTANIKVLSNDEMLDLFKRYRNMEIFPSSKSIQRLEKT